MYLCIELYPGTTLQARWVGFVPLSISLRTPSTTFGKVISMVSAVAAM